jgi:hypothetical protein
VRILFVGVVAAFGFLSLCGCSGSSFHGTLGGGSGSGPTPESGQPVVSGLSPASVVAGGPTFTITVSGKNFAQGDTVEWGSTPLSSTFVSSTTMTAEVPNQLISHPTSDTIIVQTTVPYSLNFGATITVTAAQPPGSAGFTLSTVSVQANDMVWNPSSQQIYLSVAGTDTISPNTITALDPATGQLDASVSAGSGAYRLGVSSDGSLLYAGLNNNGSVQRFTLPGLAKDITIPLGGGTWAADIEPAPGSPDTVAVSRATSLTAPGSVVIYDGSTPRSATVSTVPGPSEPLRSLAWNSNGLDIYASFNDFASTDTLFVLSVSADGVQLSKSEQLMTGDNAFSMGNIHYSALTGYLYADDGPIIDPSAGSVVNQLPLAAVQEGLGSPVLTLDDNLGIAWVIGQLVGSQQYVLEVFDLRTDALLGSIAIPNVVGTPVKLIRWGSDGLAFLTSGANGPQQGDGVYLISGDFVTTPSAQIRFMAGLQERP